MINFIEERKKICQNYEILCKNTNLEKNASILREIETPSFIMSDGIDFIFRGNFKLNFLTRLENDHLRIILAAFDGLEQTVYHIDLSFNNLTSESMNELAKFIEKAVNLESLNLQNNQIDHEGILHLSKAILNSDSLLYLNLESNKIGTEGFMTVVEILSNNKSIKELNVCNNEADHDGIIALSSVLNFNNEQILSLNLDSPQYNSIGQESSVHIAKMLKRNKTLEKLSLRKHCFNCDAIEILAEHMMVNSKLRVLDLTANKISFKGCEMLATYLMGEYCVLQSLILSSNRTGHYGAKAIANSLTKNTTLIHLDMTKNEIDDRGLYFIATAMNKNTNLVSLKLYWNDFGQEALYQFHELATGSRKDEYFFDFTTYLVDKKFQLAYVETDINYDINVSKKYYYADPVYEEDEEMIYEKGNEIQQVYDELDENSQDKYEYSNERSEERGYNKKNEEYESDNEGYVNEDNEDNDEYQDNEESHEKDYEENVESEDEERNQDYEENYDDNDDLERDEDSKDRDIDMFD